MKNFIEEYAITSNLVDEVLSEHGLNFLSYEFLKNQNKLAKALSDKAIVHSLTALKNWVLYETGIEDLTQDLFYESFLSDCEANEQVVLVTHESISHKCAFKFLTKDFYRFSDLYEDHFCMEFFQFSYYSVALLNSKTIKFIDEDGGIHKYLVQ